MCDMIFMYNLWEAGWLAKSPKERGEAYEHFRDTYDSVDFRYSCSWNTQTSVRYNEKVATPARKSYFFTPIWPHSADLVVHKQGC